MFLHNAVATLRIKKQKLELKGFEVLTPLDTDIAMPSAFQIAISNTELIRQCDIVLADVQPFRGTEPDSGTVFEIGYAKALGKAVVTYNNPINSYQERLEEWDYKHCYGTPNFQPEAFGLKQNLMISCHCREFATFQEALKSMEGFCGS